VVANGCGGNVDGVEMGGKHFKGMIMSSLHIIQMRLNIIFKDGF
jgi:hypothetical protein